MPRIGPIGFVAARQAACAQGGAFTSLTARELTTCSPSQPGAASSPVGPPHRSLSRLLGAGLLSLTQLATLAEAQPVDVVASVAPYGWLVEQIVGDELTVEVLVQPGHDAETYQPTDQQVSRLSQARIFLKSGLAFEHSPWFSNLLMDGGGVLVDLLDGIDLLAMQEHGHAASHQGSKRALPPPGVAATWDLAHQHVHLHDDNDSHTDGAVEVDPHVWLSPTRFSQQARLVGAALSKQWPEKAPRFTVRLNQLESRLKRLDEGLRNQLFLARNQPFFVLHPSWGYFASDYSLEQVAMEKAGKNPTDRDLTKLVRQMKKARAGVIFLKPSVAPGNAGRLASELGLHVERLDPLEANVIENLENVGQRLRELFAPTAERQALGLPE